TTYQAPLLENLSADTNVVTDPQTEVSEEAASTEVTVEAVTDEATVETTDEVVATEEVVPEN
ncbi:MAG: hypothetical protein RR324_08600, partial [Cellulosilyticaceae bacterium]